MLSFVFSLKGGTCVMYGFGRNSARLKYCSVSETTTVQRLYLLPRFDNVYVRDRLIPKRLD
jgi:hypothetical protein